MEVEAVRLDIGRMGASTPMMMYSTKVVGEHMAEMIDSHVENGIEVQKTREKAWTMKDE